MMAGVFVIAEAGVNHNGDTKLALELVSAAKKCGADAVKFQTFKAEKLTSAAAPLAEYQKAAVKDASQLEMIKRLELDDAAHAAVFKRCAELGVEFMSTPFDDDSADMLERLGMARFKLPSGEITNRLLIEHVARKSRPVILSTGMSTLDEVARAVGWIKAAGKSPITVLHCVTEYPAPVDQINLRAMDALRDALHLPVGYSDHTAGLEISIAAVARGAVMIEKHLTLDRGMPGPDHKASLEPAEFAALVKAIRLVESALGDGVKRPAECEKKNLIVARRSLVAARDLPAGRTLEREDLVAKRPGNGVSPADLDSVLGRALRKPLRRDEALTKDFL